MFSRLFGNNELSSFGYKIGDELAYELPLPSSYFSKWKLYSGTKYSSGEAVSIFGFSKPAGSASASTSSSSTPSSSSSSSTSSSSSSSTIPSSLMMARNLWQKLKVFRHPHILKYVDGIEISTHIYIVTEPVTSLSHFIHQVQQAQAASERGDVFTSTTTTTVTTSSSSPAQSTSSTTATTSSVTSNTPMAPMTAAQVRATFSLGLHQIFSAVSWLSNEVSSNHLFIHPSSIFVTGSGDWKLSGFHLTTKFNESIPVQLYKRRFTVVPPKYRCPELATNAAATTSSHDDDDGDIGTYDEPVVKQTSTTGPAWSIDSWQIGCLVYELFNYPSFTSPTELTRMHAIPLSLQPDYKKLLATNPNSRLNPQQLIQNNFFQNDLVVTVNFLENLALKSTDDKEHFFTNFAKNVDDFPSRICRYKIVPQLCSSLDFGSGLSCFSSILTALLKISQQLPSTEFTQLVLPSVVKLFSNNERSIRVHLLQHLNEFAPHLSAELIEQQVWPNLVTGFADSHALLRELTVKSLPHLIDKLPDRIVSDQLSKILFKMISDPEPAIRTNTTYCVAKISNRFSKENKDKLLVPIFTRVIRDPFPPAREAAIVSLLVTVDMYPAPELACKWLPALAPSTVDPNTKVRDAALKAINAIIPKLQAHSDTMATEPLPTQSDVNSISSSASGNTNTNSSSGGGNTGAVAGAEVLNAGVGYVGALGSWAVGAVSRKVFGSGSSPTHAPTASPTSASAATPTNNSNSFASTTNTPSSATLSSAPSNTNIRTFNTLSSSSSSSSSSSASSAPASSSKSASSSSSSSLSSSSSGWDDAFGDMDDNDDDNGDDMFPVVSLSVKKGVKSTTLSSSTTAATPTKTSSSSSSFSRAASKPTSSKTNTSSDNDWSSMLGVQPSASASVSLSDLDPLASSSSSTSNSKPASGSHTPTGLSAASKPLTLSLQKKDRPKLTAVHVPIASSSVKKGGKSEENWEDLLNS